MPYKVPSGITVKLLQRSQAQLPAFSPQQLANSLWGLAKLGVLPSATWAQQYAAAAVVRLRRGEFSPQELSSMAWSVARLRLSPGSDWTDAFLRASYAQVSRMSADHLSQVRKEKERKEKCCVRV